MAFKSHAQRQHCLDKVRQGKMTRAQFDEYDKDTPSRLPKRVGEEKKIPGPMSIPKPRKKPV